MQEELDNVNQEIEKEPWYKGPIKIILSIFLILLMILWFIPAYAIKIDPNPSNIPSIEDVVPVQIIENEVHRKYITVGMVDGSNPFIKEAADKIVVKACGDKGKICHAKAIFYFVRDNFNYVSDPTAYEYVKTAKQSLVSKGGDCDDAAVLASSLLNAVGIKTRFVFITNHVYIQAYLPSALKRYKTEDNWVNLDLTCNNCEFGEIPITYLNSVKRYLG